MTHTILTVDDDSYLLELIRYNLANGGYDIITATDGQAGLKSFFDNRPDMVILDVAMPKMNTAAIKASERHPKKYTAPSTAGTRA